MININRVATCANVKNMKRNYLVRHLKKQGMATISHIEDAEPQNNPSCPADNLPTYNQSVTKEADVVYYDNFN